MSPRVVIIGAGALGKGLAALLAGHADVILYECNRIKSRALMKGGLLLKEGCHAKRVKVQIITSLNSLKDKRIDILIFSVKVRDLKVSVREAASLDPKVVFFPQNGLFDLDWARRYFKNARNCRGVTTMACQEAGPDQVELFYRGSIYVGDNGARRIAGLFREAGIEARAYHDPAGCVWAKLIFSAVMNSLPVITGGGYEVLKDSETWKLVRDAVEEGRRVARALNVRLAFDPLLLISRVRMGDLTGIRHRGSMLQDLSAGRPTELKFITGALIAQARKQKIKTPALNLIHKKARLQGA